MMVQYVKKGSKKQGVLVSFVKDGKIHIGWSKLCKRDKFNKDFGKKIAFGRAKKPIVKVIPSMSTHVQKFIERNKRYYKDKEVANTFVKVDQLGQPRGNLEV